MNQKPARTFNWKLFLASLVVLLCLVLAAEGWYYWRLKGKLSATTPAPLFPPPPQSPQSSQIPSPAPTFVPTGKFTATENIDVYDSPDGKKLGYFVPGQSFTPTDKKEGNWLEVLDAEQKHTLWIQKESPYKPTEKTE